MLAREDVPGEKRLVAYFCRRRGISLRTALRAHLERALPEYMVPAGLCESRPPAAYPERQTGPHVRFPLLGTTPLAREPTKPAKDPVETAIAAIWAKFLHLERVGRHDDFFSLGGHSLIALRVIGEINKTLKAL